MLSAYLLPETQYFVYWCQTTSTPNLLSQIHQWHGATTNNKILTPINGNENTVNRGSSTLKQQYIHKWLGLFLFIEALVMKENRNTKVHNVVVVTVNVPEKEMNHCYF